MMRLSSHPGMSLIRAVRAGADQASGWADRSRGLAPNHTSYATWQGTSLVQEACSDTPAASPRGAYRDGSPMAEDSCRRIRCDGDRRLLLPIPTSREFSTLNSRRQPSASAASSAYGDVRGDAAALPCISASRRRPGTPIRRTSGAVAGRPRAGTSAGKGLPRRAKAAAILTHGVGQAPACNVCRVHHDLFHQPPDRRRGRRRGASAPRARPGCEGASGGAGDPRRGPGRTRGSGVGASRRGCPGDIGPGPGFPVVHGGLRDRPAAVRPPGPHPRRPGFRSFRDAGSPVRLRAPAGRRGQGWPAGGNHVDGDVARGPGAHPQGCGPDSRRTSAA